MLPTSCCECVRCVHDTHGHAYLRNSSRTHAFRTLDDQRWSLVVHRNQNVRDHLGRCRTRQAISGSTLPMVLPLHRNRLLRAHVYLSDTAAPIHLADAHLMQTIPQYCGMVFQLPKNSFKKTPHGIGASSWLLIDELIVTQRLARHICHHRGLWMECGRVRVGETEIGCSVTEVDHVFSNLFRVRTVLLLSLLRSVASDRSKHETQAEYQNLHWTPSFRHSHPLKNDKLR